MCAFCDTSIIFTVRFHFGIRTNIRYGTISEIHVVDQKFPISYIILSNYITVKEWNFKFTCIKNRVYYPKANRKKCRTYSSNYEQFLSPFQVITIWNLQKKLRIAREDWN